jgi:hypothetical protein
MTPTSDRTVGGSSLSHHSEHHEHTGHEGHAERVELDRATFALGEESELSFLADDNQVHRAFVLDLEVGHD